MIVLLATKNPHKLAEARVVLSPLGLEVRLLDVRKLEIQSNSLAEIARFAAENIRASAGAPVLVEDAGLFIDALGGFPGPYSAYVYSTIGLRGVLKLMEGVEDRRARFESAVAVKTPKGEVEVFVGAVEGVIAREPRGTRGFGFDPIFVPKGYSRTFAEMTIEEKCRVSHRARALRAAAAWILEQFPQS